MEILDLSEIRVDPFPKKITFSPQKIGPKDFEVEFSDLSDNKADQNRDLFIAKFRICRSQSESSDLSDIRVHLFQENGPFHRKKKQQKNRFKDLKVEFLDLSDNRADHELAFSPEKNRICRSLSGYFGAFRYQSGPF